MNYRGFTRPGFIPGHYNQNAFLVQQLLNRVSTATLVRVQSVTNSGDVSPVGFVDVQPLVNQIDGSENSMPHGIIHGLPYFRIQGGKNAIILDPQGGDIGIAVFADHDISSVKGAKGQANPGSFRRFDMADGLYLGGFLNGTPQQYIQFNEEGITLTSTTAITLNAPQIMLNGELTQGTGSHGGAATMAGPVTVTNDVTSGGISVQDHVHSGVETGTDNTGKPM